MSGEQAIFNLEIKKKSGLSLNPDIHDSKVFSSGYIVSLAVYPHLVLNYDFPTKLWILKSS